MGVTLGWEGDQCTTGALETCVVCSWTLVAISPAFGLYALQGSDLQGCWGLFLKG